MGKIDIIKLSYGPGDPVTIYRNSGRGDISGIIEEIGDVFILLRRPGARRPDCVFEDLIAGCGDYEPTGEAPVEEKTVNEAPRVSSPASESVTPAEEPTETEPKPATEPEQEKTKPEAPETQPEKEEAKPETTFTKPETKPGEEIKEDTEEQAEAEPAPKEVRHIENEIPPMGFKVLGKIDLSQFSGKKDIGAHSLSSFGGDTSTSATASGSADVTAVRDYINERLENLNASYDLDVDDLLSTAQALSESLPASTGTVAANAHVVGVKQTFCQIEKLDGTPLRCYLSRVTDLALLTQLKNWSGEKIPVYIVSHEMKNGKENVNVLTGVYSLSKYLDMLEDFLSDKNLVFARLLFDSLKGNPHFKALLKGSFKADANHLKVELLKVTFTQFDLPIIYLDGQAASEDTDKMAFKRIDSQIKKALARGDLAEAVKIIDEAVENAGLPNKYISSLLLIKAQSYSSADDVEKACEAYRELIAFNESSQASKNNLSHLYFELARLLSTDPSNQDEVIRALDAAINYNPNNKLAADLRVQMTSVVTPSAGSSTSSDDSLIISSTAGSSMSKISKMIDVDIQEFRFTNKDILENNGVPTSAIAQSLYDEAVQSTDPETYPKYLEAAKAYRGLKVGSYNFQNYQYVVASYSRLKGNHLLGTIRKALQDKSADETVIRRLKDSAQSYYLETLDLWSAVSSDVFDYAKGERDSNSGKGEAIEVVLEVLANYLKLEVAYYYFKNGVSIDFSVLFASKFKTIFNQCVNSKNAELEKIAYKTIIQIGSNSIDVWNKLTHHPNGTGDLYGILRFSNKRQHVYEVVNSISLKQIDTSLAPGLFFKDCFQSQSTARTSFESNSKVLLEDTMEPHSIEAISAKWESLSEFWTLLSETELETKTKIDEVLTILKPYLSRKEVERTNLLIQAQSRIEEQIEFINENTTYYGRTFFFTLLTKWRKDIKSLLDERIQRTYPVLSVQPDPQYILKSADGKAVNLLITNTGESSADKYQMEVLLMAGGYTEVKRYETDEVIASGEKQSVTIDVTGSKIADYPSVSIKVKITPFYLTSPIEPKTCDFTVENEPDGNDLQIEDILWSDSKTPTEQLFVGREEILNRLVRHYKSIEKHEPYILYGLTRTGKSSILDYLAEKISGTVFRSAGEEYTIIPFSIDFSTGASFGKASDFWNYVINDCVCEQKLDDLDVPETYWNFSRSNPRAKDFRILLQDLQGIKLYPLFLVDEFSYIKDLIENDIVNKAFLHSLRQYSLDGLASFLYAGTYDIKSLLKDSQYGFTGALVTAHDEQIDKIDDASAEKLMDVMKDSIWFTDEAKAAIHTLSGNIPYFIQILCKNCGYYAVENRRKFIGYPELKHVVDILVGKDAPAAGSMVLGLPENKFQNNQYSPLDPPEVSVLISSIVQFNRGQQTARGVSHEELVRLWGEHNVQAYQPKLSKAISILLEKKVLLEYTDEGKQVYKLAVDLFRQWWDIHHQDINRELSTIM